MLVKKAGAQLWKREELKEAVEALARDMHKLRKHVKIAERSMAEHLSRHVSP